MEDLRIDEITKRKKKKSDREDVGTEKLSQRAKKRVLGTLTPMAGVRNIREWLVEDNNEF